MSQTVDLILIKTLDMENSIQSMFIITIYTLMLIKDQEMPEAFKELMQINSFKKVNSPTNPDGDKYKKHLFYLKLSEHKFHI